MVRPSRPHNSIHRGGSWLTVVIILSGAVTLAVGRSSGPAGRPTQSSPPSAQAPSGTPGPGPQGNEQQARATCGGCHAFPPPYVLPRQVWRDEFVRMMFIRDGRLPPLGPATTVNR